MSDNYDSKGGNQNAAKDQATANQYNYYGSVAINRDGHEIRVPLQLPPKVQHFKDREMELNKLLNDLQNGEAVTLCGAGGIGKTALAAKALWHLTEQGRTTPEHFPDGVLWYSFYSEPRADAALEHIARSFDEEPQSNPQVAAQRVLSGRRVLLCLDGAEDADDLQRVQSVAATCGLIVTSRKHQDAVKDWQDIPTLPLEEAVKLLRDWSKDTSQDTEAIEEICRHVGGLPLAVRLIGRYLRENSETPAEYLEWLEEEPFEALEQGEHRDRSVNRLLSRSLKQLSEPARQMLSLLGLLALAPFGVKPLAVALGCTLRPCRKSLGELVNYGLLLRKGDMYSVSHALVHSYARQQLSAPSETLEGLARHYSGFAEKQSQQGLEGYARLDLERPHILRLLEHCQEQQQWSPVRDLVETIHTYLKRQGYRTEAQIALQINLEAARHLEDRQNEGWCLNALGLTAAYQGDYTTAEAYYTESLSIALEIGDLGSEGATQNNLGQIYAARGQSANALLCLEQSLAIRQEIGDKIGEGVTLNNLATTAYARGDFTNALQYLKQSLAITQEIGDKAGEGATLNNLGQFYQVQGDSATAQDYLKQSLAITQEIGDKVGEGATLNNIGQVYQTQGDSDNALDYLEQSLVIRQEIGDKVGEAITCWNIGLIYQEQNDLERAEHYISRCVHINESIDHPSLQKAKETLEELREQREGNENTADTDFCGCEQQ